jgi:inosine-uridine nucleoside N-ribohydrolase
MNKSLFFYLAIGFCLLGVNPMFSYAGSPMKIIFDTDMGSDCDDVGALALLHRYADLEKADILGCMFSSGKVPYGAAIIQAINRYYGRPDIPIGAYQKNDLGDPVDKMNAEQLAKSARFGNTIIHNQDAPDLTRLSRKLLAAQPDESVTYITVGHTKGLYDILLSQADDVSPLSGKELIAQKVQRWVALGALGANNKENHYTKDWNFFFNGTAPYTHYLVEHFPAPIVYVDAGSKVMTGKSLKNTPPGNIVRTAYQEWLAGFSNKTLDDQRPSWDLATVYYAVEGVGEFLESQGQGCLDFDPEKGCRWIQEPTQPRQTFIRQKPGTNQSFADYLNQMIAAPPARGLHQED